MRYSVFTAGKSYYGIPIQQVQEFDFEYKLSPVPYADSRISGVSSLRGRIITVIDLRKCLGIKEGNEPRRRKVLVLDSIQLCKDYDTFDERFSKDVLGVVVDRIEGIVDLDFHHSLNIDQSKKGNFIEAVVNHEDKVLNLLSFPLIIQDIYKGP
ncbi:MAG: chemotaxis protein CheW [Oligoflexales bacterium]